MKAFLLVTLAMIAFAANSVIGRVALTQTSIDPALYSVIRLSSGAIMLCIMMVLSTQSSALRQGNWRSALALFVYVVAFSWAYLSLDAGLGALVLFASVQTTMIGWDIVKGQRPNLGEWAGLLLAMGAFAWLVSPGAQAPNGQGVLLMILSGLAWGVYSVWGRKTSDPMAATAGNFWRASLLSLPLVFFGLPNLSSLPLNGVLLACLSGAITSALGYVLWYKALPLISSTQGAIVQLTVPVIAAAGGMLFLAEPLTLRFILSSICILGGVALAILSRQFSKASQ